MSHFKMRLRLGLILLVSPLFFILIGLASVSFAQPISSQFQSVEVSQEQLRWHHERNGVRGLILAPMQLKQKRRCLVVFATPNGNTLEQTLGCRVSEKLDWRFDIQHVAAQIRWLRNHDTTTDYIVAVVQSPQLSWPEFRRTTPDSNRWIASFVESLMMEVSANEVVLACHSGGGSFLWGWMNAYEELPEEVHRLLFLDANYSFSVEEGHDRKLHQWLSRSKENVLVVVAYDDREIQLNGKKVVGSDGGTYRATERMVQSLSGKIHLDESDDGEVHHWLGLDGQIRLMVHQNPENKILHTALVGEMNGLAVGLSLSNKGSPAEHRLKGPRVYDEWIQADPFLDPRISSAKMDTSVEGKQLKLQLPARSLDAETGSQFCERVAKLDGKSRELETVKSILSGNVPSISRTMVGIRVDMIGKENRPHQAIYYVTRDYMAIGSDEDYVRFPLTPRSAIQICDRLECEMITEKVSDDIYSAADCRLDPIPLTADRDQVSAFVAHNKAIEARIQDTGQFSLIVGIKKDIVMTNRIKEKTHRVAIYGWHYRDGRVIQPIYVGHVDWYVDYSHGLRLMSNQMRIDGVDWKVRDVLSHNEYNELLSREGTIDVAEIRSLSKW